MSQRNVCSYTTLGRRSPQTKPNIFGCIDVLCTNVRFSISQQKCTLSRPGPKRPTEKPPHILGELRVCIKILDSTQISQQKMCILSILPKPSWSFFNIKIEDLNYWSQSLRYFYWLDSVGLGIISQMILLSLLVSVVWVKSF